MIRENRPYDDLAIGDKAELHRLCTPEDLYVFAHASGNHNPMHLPDAALDPNLDAALNKTSLKTAAPAMWLGSLISAVLGNILPGPGTLYLKQQFDFVGHAYAGDALIAQVEVLAKEAKRQVRLAATVRHADDDRIIVQGEALVVAPEKKIRFDETTLPGLTLARHVNFDRMIKQASSLKPIMTAVIAPEEVNALKGALLGAEATLITPILIGDRAKIMAAAAECAVDLADYTIIEAETPDQAAQIGVRLAKEGKVHALMKGHLHTDELLNAVLHPETGLRTGRRLTHVFVMDVPGMQHPLLVSDAAINIAPDLKTKVDIVQNAIDLALAIGIEEPKVGVLSAVELVNPKIPSSIDAAILSKMAERGQITGGLVDGPLAMDNAVDLQAARTKGIRSMVAGRADILIAPNLDAGNMIAKELSFMAHAESAGLALGAKVPIILTSRADDDMARLASCAVAALYQTRMTAKGMT